MIYFSTATDPIPQKCYGQTADKLKRFLDSLLQKSGKLRALVKDLRENYSGSSSSKESFDCKPMFGHKFNDFPTQQNIGHESTLNGCGIDFLPYQIAPPPS